VHPMTSKSRIARFVSCTASPSYFSDADLQRRRAARGAYSDSTTLRCDVTSYEYNMPQLSPGAPTRSKWDRFCAIYGSRDELCECHGPEGDALLYEVLSGSRDPLWRRVLSVRTAHASDPRDIRLWYPLLKTTYSTATASDMTEIDTQYSSRIGMATSRKGRQLRQLMRDSDMLQSFAQELLSSVGLDFGNSVEIGVAASVVYLVVEALNGGLLMPQYLAKIALTELLSCLEVAPTSASEQVGSHVLVHALFRVCEPWAQTALLAEWRDMLQSIVRSVACTLTDAVRAVAQELRAPAAPAVQWEWCVALRSLSRPVWIRYPALFSAAMERGFQEQLQSSALHPTCGPTKISACGWAEEVSFEGLFVVRGGTVLSLRRRVAASLEEEDCSGLALPAPFVSTSESPAGSLRDTPAATQPSQQLVEHVALLAVEYQGKALEPSAGTTSGKLPPRTASALTSVGTPSRPGSSVSGGEDVDWTSPTTKKPKKAAKHLKRIEHHWSTHLRQAMCVGGPLLSTSHQSISVEPQQVVFDGVKLGFLNYYSADPGERPLVPDFVCSGVCLRTQTATGPLSTRALPQSIGAVLSQRNITEKEVAVWVHDERCAVQLCFLMSLQSLLRVLYDSGKYKCDAKVLFGRTSRGADVPEGIDVTFYEHDLKPKDTYGLLEMQQHQQQESTTQRQEAGAPPGPQGCRAVGVVGERHNFSFDAFVCGGDSFVEQLLRTALICNAGGVGLIRYLLQLAKDEQAQRHRRMAEKEARRCRSSAAAAAEEKSGCEEEREEEEEDDDSSAAFFHPGDIANASHVTLVLEASPAEPASGGQGIAVHWATSADRVHLARRGMQRVSMCAAIIQELRRSTEMHVPMPLGGMQPLRAPSKSVLHRDREVNDEIALAKPQDPNFLSRRPINKHYLFNFVKSSTEVVIARSATASAEAGAQHPSVFSSAMKDGLPLRCASVPLRVVDGSVLRQETRPLPPATPLDPLPARHAAPAKDVALAAPSSNLPPSPFALPPKPLQAAEQGIEGSVYAAILARSRSLSPNSKRSKQASDCLNRIAEHAQHLVNKTKKITAARGRGEMTQEDAFETLQTQLKSYKSDVKLLREGRGDLLRRPLDLR
jgi:hypothetical protein